MREIVELLTQHGRATAATALVLTPIIVPAASFFARGEVNSQTSALRVTVVYDNYSVESELGTGWGYAAIVEWDDHTWLFDTGAAGQTLMGNLRALGFDPQRIEAVILSHAHGDHTLGLDSLLASGARPTVYVVPSFPAEFKERIGEMVELIEVEPGQAVVDGVFTTGALAGPVKEQALVVESAKGLVVLTGCAHPGIAKIVSEAKRLGDANVHLVTGGFHLARTPVERVREIVAEFRRLGVQRVAPSHCTGDVAIGLFRDAYGDDLVESGVGRVFQIFE